MLHFWSNVTRLPLFHDFDGAEYLVHHLWDDGVAVGFEGFGAPLSERKGKAVHIKGKPIISSVNRGDRREVIPTPTPCDFCASFVDLVPFANSKMSSPSCCC